ncbi:uncharacterized protein LOC110704991 [Chenopodium quinoa]|uniref:DUF7798 domain-containing protein n=1 Tax=Chenopodium quinoa TaxID=63459 RepID=A0A803LNW7_CHEQI|nr:uncharacterized protein LOC110704991 [Chenopodium quinoa]
MEEATNKSSMAEERENEVNTEPETKAPVADDGGGGGWGGWGFSPLSYLSDLQKAAALAAEEIRTAAESFGNIEAEEESSIAEGDTKDSVTEGEDGQEKEKLMSALDKLEKASEDTFFSQGLKVIDGSVENFASGAWKALGSAFQGGSNLIQKLEHSAVSIADSVQHDASSIAPSFLETGKAITFKGMQVLENVGKETMDLLISETGMEVDKKFDGDDHESHDNQYEEMTFDRCFYIYGGPEQLEELEALSSHYALIFNRRKGKLSSEEKSLYEGKVKQVEEILNLNTESERTTLQSDKGKNIEIGAEDTELKSLHDSSLSKAADLAAGLTSALAGVSANDIIQRTTGRLEALHSEGVHRLSEICCFAMTQLLMLGKSMISSASKNQEENADENMIKIEWPEDSLEKAKIIRSKAQSMIESMEAVSNSFITGISDVTEAYLAAMKLVSTTDSHEKSIQDRADAFSEHLRADQTIAVDKIQDGLQYLCFVAMSTSMPPAP